MFFGGSTLASGKHGIPFFALSMRFTQGLETHCNSKRKVSYHQKQKVP